VGLFLLAFGIFFAALFLLNNLLKTIFHSEKIRFLDLALAFLVTLVTLTALIANNTLEAPEPLVEQVALWLALAVIGISVIITLLEIFRPQRLKGSRGILGISSGLLLIISTFTVPFVAVYFSLSSNTIATSSSDDVEMTEEASATDELVERTERFNTLFRAVREVIADEIGIDEVTVFTQLDAGTPLAKIVEENGGSVERVVERISDIMQAGIREAADTGEMNPIQAALLLSQMDNLIFIAVNTSLTEFGGRFGGPTPTGTRPSLLTLLTETAVPMQTTSMPSTTPQPTLTATPVPTETRTPRPTSTPSATRFQFSTRTPTPTPTQVRPCLATTQYNLRLRALPTQDSDTLLTIPYATAIELYGHNRDSTWWLTNYENQSGWVDGSYLILSAACSTLPVHETD
jgi:hypothetical protein